MLLGVEWKKALSRDGLTGVKIKVADNRQDNRDETHGNVGGCVGERKKWACF